MISSSHGEGPNTIALFGGGRWARVLIDVLSNIVSQSTQIFWVTRHNYELANEHVRSRGYQRVVTRPECRLEDPSACDAAIVATSTYEHLAIVSRTVNLGIPTLCEKPVAATMRETVQLADDASHQGSALGVNLEFFYASYAQDFSAAISNLAIRAITFVWHDPWTELRHGETKHPDLHTPIVHDMLPHCCSLARLMLPQCRNWSLDTLRVAADGSVHLRVRHKEIESNFFFSRRAARRVRRVQINDGEAILDFSEEPGHSIIRGKVSQNHWRGLRPLSAALDGFLLVARSPGSAPSWPLSVHHTLDILELTHTAADRLKEVQLSTLRKLRTECQFDADHPEASNLLLDFFLPIEAQRGIRRPARTYQQRSLAIREALTYIDAMLN